MSDQMTPSQRAAAFHGIAINGGFPPADRFRAAIQALDMYEAEIARLHSWAGIMSLVDEHYPVDIFPVLDDSADRDSGPRILSLLRRLDEARAEVERMRAVVEAAPLLWTLYEAWRETATVEPTADQMDAGYISLLSIEDSHRLGDAFEAILDRETEIRAALAAVDVFEGGGT